MEDDNPFQAAQTVDPEVRAYVYSLVTALGGTGADENGAYVLGDDALGCLRDLKRWLKLYDEKTNRLDVARCLAEANLVSGDLLPILSSWREDAVNDKTKARIALAALELLVPLSWPLETGAALTVNHARHTPYLQQAQVSYKASILGHDTSSILRTIVRIGLPSIAMPRSDRTSRDEGIIKLMLYFLRNIAAISIAPNLPTQGLENEVSRSATIEGFRFQDVFALILTMCSNMGEDFDQQDVIILEILFYLTKGIDVEKLWMTEDQQKSRKTSELKDVLSKESSMHREYAKTAPTRHGRFGTMIWVKRDDHKISTVSGQDNLRNGQNTLMKMDKSKTFNKPQQKKKDEQHTIFDFDKAVHLTRDAGESLRMFAEEFLDSGFNPLFVHLRKAIEREADRVQEMNVRQYFFVVAWFLKAERARREYQKKSHQRNKLATDFEVDSYTLVAGVLNQETFILLNKMMQKACDEKEWRDLNATMRCFTQILLTVQEMVRSPLEEDQDIAENIQNRIFYEETTHDRILAILRGHKDQGFGYLDACTELSHVFLRMLERYSKDNGDLQIRSRRRARRKKRAERQTTEDGEENNDSERSENEDAVDAAQVSRERKFDFGRFAAKFSTQKSVDTYIALLSYYRDLSVEQLKRAHRFLYRVAFKQDLAVLLYRLDVIALLYKMIKGPEGLDPANKMFKEWEELSKQVLKKMFKKIAERPELVTELLFSKIPATLYYLEFGHEKQTSSTKRTTTELEVKGMNRTLDERVGIVVAALEADKKMHYVLWVKRSLELAISERQSWEAEAVARGELPESNTADAEGSEQVPRDPQAPVSYSPFVVKPRDDADTQEAAKNAKLRLLMSLVGMESVDEDDGTKRWHFPPGLSSQGLGSTLSILEKHILNPQTEIEGYSPAELLRRAHVVETEADQDQVLQGFLDDSEGSDGAEEFMFPDNIKTRTQADGMEAPKKRRLLKKRKADEIDADVVEERRKAREEAALDRRRKIKSELYIRESDDETDDEADRVFFEQEALRRQKQASSVLKALTTGQQNTDPKKRKSTAKDTSKAKKRKSTSDEDDDSLGNSSDSDAESEREKSSIAADVQETPISSQVQDSDDELFLGNKSRSGERESEKRLTELSKQVTADDSDDEVVSQAPRRRVRAGFIVDSDDDE